MAKETNQTNAAPETLEQALAIIDLQGKKIEELQQTNAELSTNAEKAATAIENHTTEVEDLKKVIAEQNDYIQKMESIAAKGYSKSTIVIGNKTYQINSGAKLNKVAYSPLQIAENLDIAKALLEIEGQNILTLED